MNDERLIRLRNLRDLRDLRQWKPADFVREIGSSYSYWRDLLIDDSDKSLGEKKARSIEETLGLPRGTLDQPEAFKNSRSKAGPPLTSGAISHKQLSHTLPRVTWEGVMRKVPDSLFVLSLRDDALAPVYGRGLDVVWSRARAPLPGRMVLVRDKHGQLHARIYHQGRAPGEWTAAATNEAYVNLSSEDGLSILAVHKGILEPDD